MVAEGLDARGFIGGEPCAGGVACGAEAEDAGEVLCAAASAELLRAADAGDEADASAGVEGADALRAVELVGGAGEEVDGGVGEVCGELADALGGVGVEEDASGSAEVEDVGDGLECAGFVVGPLDADERGVVGDGGLDGVGGDDAEGVGFDEGGGGAVEFGFDGGGAVADGFVLDGGGDEASFAWGHRGEGASEGEVDGLGGAAGEGDGGGADTQE